MASYLKPRRGTYSTASSKLTSSADGVLKNGEIFFELNNSGAGKGVGKIKMGDGSTDYSSLSYFLSLQDSPITFTDNGTTDQISSLVSGITIPNAFRYIKSSLAYLKTQVTNLNNEKVNYQFTTGVKNSYTTNSYFTAPENGFIFTSITSNTTEAMHVNLYLDTTTPNSNSKIGTIRKFKYGSGDTTDVYQGPCFPIKKGESICWNGISTLVTLNVIFIS